MAPYVPVDVVEVRCWGRTVGAAAYDPARAVFAFGYAPEWVADGPELSPLVMPNRTAPHAFPDLDRATFHGLPGLLADALPDAFGNAVIDRWMAQQGIDPARITSLDRLAYAGERAIGALTFHPATEVSPTATALQIADIVTQARSVIADRAAQAETVHDALEQLIQVGSSAGGARAKAIVLLNPATGQVRSPYADPEPGFDPWILKLDGVANAADGSVNALDAPEEYTRIEYAYALMAAQAGLEMAPTLLLPEGPRAHFLTQRFDRTDTGERLHMQTLCGLAHLDFRMRYAHSYEQYLHTIRTLGLGVDALQQAYRRMVFNVAAVNRDDHTKNVAFLMDPDGQWSLAPAYDVTHAYNPVGHWTQRHQMSVHGSFDGITVDDLYAVADAFGIPAFRRTTDEVLDAVAAWPTFAAEAGVSAEATERIADDMSRFDPRALAST
jgi:serine/threonine-protein kinase HipA